VDTRYSIFMPYYGGYASQYEEDLHQLFSLIKTLNRYSQITLYQLDSALICTGLSPRSLYEQASTGRYTADMARLDEEFGFPVQPITPLSFGEAVQQLVTMAGESEAAMGKLGAAIMELANIPDQPVASKMVTERTPYYQKNKQKWWK